MGKGKQRYFEELKKNIIQALVLALPNLQHPFEVQTNAIECVMGLVLM